MAKQSSIPPWASGAVIIVVLIVWAANFTAGIFISEYREHDPPAVLNGAFLGVVGVVFGIRQFLGGNGKDGD